MGKRKENDSVAFNTEWLDKVIEQHKGTIHDADKFKRDVKKQVDDACQITNLSPTDLFNRLDFQENDLTPERSESLLAELRAILWLKEFDFSNIMPLKAKKNVKQHDFNAKLGKCSCAIEVFCLTREHGQQPNQSLGCFVNIDPGFKDSKFEKNFLERTEEKFPQLEQANACFKILLCVLNQEAINALNTEKDFKTHIKYLYEKLCEKRKLPNNYSIGICLRDGAGVIYPELHKDLLIGTEHTCGAPCSRADAEPEGAAQDPRS